MITICFQIILLDGSQKRCVIHVSDECTLEDLWNEATQQVHAHVVTATATAAATATATATTKSKETTKGSYSYGKEVLVDELKFGFPPQTIQCNDSNKDLKIYDIGITNQERIIVGISQSVSKQLKQPHVSDATNPSAVVSTTKQSSDTNITSIITTTSRPPRRKAATIATESFTESIKLMNDIEKPTKVQKKSSTSISTSTSTSTKSRSMTSATKEKLATSRHFRSLETKSSSPASARRLRDGAVINSNSNSNSNNTCSPRNRKSKGLISSSSNTTATTSIEEGLLNTLSSKTKGARLLREGWKQAVNSAYEQNQSVARLAGIQAGNVSYELTVKDDDRTNTSFLKVRYPKGIQGRRSDKYYEDMIDQVIEFNVLKSVISTIVQTDPTPEALRPSYLALLSPRVLWSLMYHYDKEKDNARQTKQKEEEEEIINLDDKVVLALKWIQPELNWSYLRRRATKLSSKAKENLRQQQEKVVDNKTMYNWEAAVSTITSVEEAMEKMYENINNKQNIEENDNNEYIEINWKLNTPNDIDIDELIECIQAGCIDDCINNNHHDEEKMKYYAQILINKCNIHNWRELANADSKNLYNIFFIQLLDVTTTKTTINNNNNIEITIIENWIDYAQDKSINEIIYEICDNDDNAIELLQEAVHSGTPKDLAGWVTIIPELHKEIIDYYYSCRQNNQHLSSSSSMMMTKNNIDIIPNQETLKRWCQKSHIAINQLDWLNWYVTPIE